MITEDFLSSVRRVDIAREKSQEENRANDNISNLTKKNSLSSKLAKLMSSEKEITERLQKFDQKYNYFEENIPKTYSKKKPITQPKFEEPITKTIKKTHKFTEIDRPEKFDIYQKLDEKKVEKNIQKFRSHGVKAGNLMRKYPNYLDVKMPRRKEKNFIFEEI